MTYTTGEEVAFTHPFTDSGSAIIIYNGTLHVPQWWAPQVIMNQRLYIAIENLHDCVSHDNGASPLIVDEYGGSGLVAHTLHQVEDDILSTTPIGGVADY